MLEFANPVLAIYWTWIKKKRGCGSNWWKLAHQKSSFQPPTTPPMSAFRLFSPFSGAESRLAAVATAARPPNFLFSTYCQPKPATNFPERLGAEKGGSFKRWGQKQKVKRKTPKTRTKKRTVKDVKCLRILQIFVWRLCFKMFLGIWKLLGFRFRGLGMRCSRFLWTSERLLRKYTQSCVVEL